MRNGQREREFNKNQLCMDGVISAEITVHDSFEFNLKITTYTFLLILSDFGKSLAFYFLSIHLTYTIIIEVVGEK